MTNEYSQTSSGRAFAWCLQIVGIFLALFAWPLAYVGAWQTVRIADLLGSTHVLIALGTCLTGALMAYLGKNLRNPASRDAAKPISDAATPHAGIWLLGMLLMGAAWVMGVAGGALILFIGAGWSGGAVNPNTALFFMLGVCLAGGGICIGLVGHRMWKRVDEAV